MRPLVARAHEVTPANTLFNEDASFKTTRNSSPDQRITEADVKALESAALELKGSIVVLHQSAFSTFEQSLVPPPQVKYRTVVKEECKNDEFVALKGTRCKEPHGCI